SGGLLGLPGNLLGGLSGGLTLRLQLVQRSLYHWKSRWHIRSEGEADEQHDVLQEVQTHGPDDGPEVAFRLRTLGLLHQGASVINPTLPTSACCRPPMAAITVP